LGYLQVKYPQMSCIYKDQNSNAACVACRRAQALKQISDSIEGVFTPEELMATVCNNPNPEAQTQCPAFKDIQEYGISSSWRRR